MCLEYGSRDISRIFHWLLSTQGSFPYPVESGSLPDYILLNNIKVRVLFPYLVESVVRE